MAERQRTTEQTESRTLYRAADSYYIDTGTSFAETLEAAECYLANPGFGGAGLWSTTVPSGTYVLDLRGLSVCDAAAQLGCSDPGAIGIDEWLPREPTALTAIRAMGAMWALVSESYPGGTTWIYCGDADDYCAGREPELTPIDEVA